MNKLVLFCIIAVLSSCQSPTDVTKEVTTQISSDQGVAHTIIFKNSKWETVKTETIYLNKSATSSDALASAQAEADQYNYQTIQDFYRVYLDTAPDLSTAPDVTIYYCNPENNNINAYWEHIPRQMLVDRYDAFLKDAGAQVIYIDHVPPPPVLDKDVNPYAYYCITIVDTLPDGTEQIIHVDHCGYNPDQSWTPGSISDWPNVDAYYASMVNTWNIQTALDNVGGAHNERVVADHSVYVIPSSS